MQQAVIVRNTVARVGSQSVSAQKTDSTRPAVPADVSRRSLLLGMVAGAATLATGVNKARAAAPVLSDLVRPLVQKLDANGDGALDVDEIRGALQRNGEIAVPRETVVRDVMAPVDFDNDGVLSVDEFSRGMALELEVDARWMRTMERDGERGVSLAELQTGLGDLGERGNDIVAAAFKMTDKNRDGRLDREEAQNAMELISAAILGDASEGEGDDGDE